MFASDEYAPYEASSSAWTRSLPRCIRAGRGGRSPSPLGRGSGESGGPPKPPPRAGFPAKRRSSRPSTARRNSAVFQAIRSSVISEMIRWPSNAFRIQEPGRGPCRVQRHRLHSPDARSPENVQSCMPGSRSGGGPRKLVFGSFWIEGWASERRSAPHPVG